MSREEIEPLIGDVKPDNKSTDSREEDEIKAITHADHQTLGSSESHERKILSPSIEEGEGMTVQGMDEKHKHKI